MALVFIGFLVGAFCSILAIAFGFAWWQVLAIYAGAGIIGLVVASIAWAIAPDDPKEIKGYQDGPPDRRPLASARERKNLREWR